MKEVATNVRVTSEETRLVNGREVSCMEMRCSYMDVPFVFLGYYYSGKEGSIQIITFTGDNLFAEYRKDFEEFLNGFEVSK